MPGTFSPLCLPLLHPLSRRSVLGNRSSCSTAPSSSRWRRDPLMPSQERLATPSVKTSLSGSRLTTKCWLVQAEASLVPVLARTARSSYLTRSWRHPKYFAESGLSLVLLSGICGVPLVLACVVPISAKVRNGAFAWQGLPLSQS